MTDQTHMLIMLGLIDTGNMYMGTILKPNG